MKSDFREENDSDEDAREEVTDEPIAAAEVYDRDEQEEMTQGRYATEATEDGIDRPLTEEEHARSTMGYFDYLEWQLSQIGGKRNKDVKVLERFQIIMERKERAD